MDKRKKLILVLVLAIAAISIAVIVAHAMYAPPQPSSGCITQPGGAAICPITTTPLG